jgi:hypothetical protein
VSATVARRQAGVMLLRHAGAGMPQLRRDHRKRHAAHRETTGVCVAQSVEIDGRVNPGRGASRAERSLLLRFAQHFPLA